MCAQVLLPTTTATRSSASTTIGIARTTNAKTAPTSNLTAFIPFVALVRTLHLARGGFAYNTSRKVFSL